MSTNATSESSRARNSRDDVVSTAMRMLASGGLPAFSMRALARELEVQPSALYWHFADKQSLLAAIADEIVASMPERAAGETLAESAAALRDALLAHMDGAEILLSSISLGLADDAALVRLQLAGEDAGLERARAQSLAGATLHFVLGHVSHEQQRAQALAAGVEVRAHPHAADDASFEAGLALLEPGTER
ncbi:TetR family transcriptional regulator [Gulosibacter sp. ACHW.36C]|uniref:TetR family transcriptional regulator n=1 Tax=Gulosibacter sediminis TaxID=1729695 RepID=A0ABY4MX00_9MICO|nr:TetR family transcriptional regulator [Gulosibacter sediminis]UQN13733.1 TetR family transcriptional regulator [Gulosibacter sediminis]